MKKILFFLLVSCMVSCINNSSTNINGTTLKTINVSVPASKWQYSNLGNNNYFYAFVEVPEITKTIFDKGEVKAYLVQDRHDNYYARKNLLPYVMHKETTDLNGDWIFYTETVDFTYGIGWVEFNFRASDFAYELNTAINPEGMEFDVVITKP